MRVLIVYETVYGNTRRVAEAIAAGFSGRGEARIVSVAELTGEEPGACDLLIVGGPTHMHGMSRSSTRRSAINVAAASGSHVPDANLTVGVREWLSQLRPSFQGQKAASFDTRNHGPAFLTGRASKGIATELRKAGFTLIVEPQSFEVDAGPSVGPDELERATRWGGSLAALLEAET
jgi:hypothetical protein